MGIFSKFSGSRKQAEKLQEEKKQKAKADNEPTEKYMHTPQHAYVDALNCVAGSSPGSTRESLREAAERRRARMSQNPSRTTMNGLHTGYSSSSALNAMGSWDTRRAVVQRDQLQISGAALGIGPTKRSYQSSPLASGPPSTAGPSTVSSYDQLEMASLNPAPLRASNHRRISSLKKSVTIQTPDHELSRMSPRSSPSSTSDEEPGTPLVTVIQPAYRPSEKSISIKSKEVPAESSFEEERQRKAKKSNKRMSIFRKKNDDHIAAYVA